MLQSISSFFSDFVRNFRFVDLIDILFVSVFLYIFINWFRKSASRKIIFTAIAFVSVYILARILGLYLTELVINILAVFIILGFIIVFQSDIRRLAYVIGAWNISKWKDRNKTFNNRVIDVLVESVTKMAEKRTGAIIVLRGNEPWEQCTTGGIPLNGSVSHNLLYSIFSTASPGHDGAVLLEDDKIIKFGVHLPLSKNLAEIGQGGTRHAASLGLSEQCDALVIVVSEERGTIKIARDGKFTPINSAAQLKEALDEYWHKYYAKQKEALTGFYKSGKINTALLSVALATVLWLIFAYQSESVFRTFTVPIEFRNLNPKLILEEPVPTDCRVTLSGSEQGFRMLRPSDLVVSLDIDKLEKGENETMISKENIKLPSGVRLYNVEPKSVRIYAAALRYINAPVRVQTTGRLPGNLRLQGLVPEVQVVTLRIPEKGNYEQRTVYTEPLDLSSVTSSSKVSLRLMPPRNSRLLPEQNSEINVRVIVSK
ncbi:MAG: diadenylate cyclase [Bacteroidota bacterium]|nr:diadenylate cyclase [Bacteroidota bacterium]MDP4194630.1 diadenylate cyclase [Bacteroidota bacterium]